MTALSDKALWGMRSKARRDLVLAARARLTRHLGGRGHLPAVVALADTALNPDILTLGFARRFTSYKRPDLLLHDRDRFGRLLCHEQRPAQIVIAGKAHPADDEGKRMVQEWVEFAQTPALRQRVVFLEDYDISLAQELVQGVDVWINMPRPLSEACGTSGMKVLVNGGLNLSVLDGWWNEAYSCDVGWAIAGSQRHGEKEQDASDAEGLYTVLEREIAPEFYDRSETGMPHTWLARIRRSMAALAPQFSSTRMLRAVPSQKWWKFAVV